MKKVVFADDTIDIAESDYFDIEEGIENSFVCSYPYEQDIAFFMEKSPNNDLYALRVFDEDIIRINTVPNKINVSTSLTGLELSWDCLINVDVYNIYRKEKSESKWTKIADTRFGSYTDENVVSGKTYSYKIKTDDNSDEVVSTSVLYLERAVLKSCVSSSSKTATLKWNKVSGAKGYYIYSSSTGKAGTWTRIANIKSGDTLSYTAKNLKYAHQTYFCIKAYNGNTVGATSSKKMLISGQPMASASFSGNAIKVKWNKLSDVAYYRVYVKNKYENSYITVATIKDPSTVSATVKSSLIKSDTCYVKVRAFYKDGSHLITDAIKVTK